MKLPKKDVKLFYKLHHSLLYYANTQYDLIDVDSPQEMKETLPAEVKVIADELYKHPHVINEFIQENPYNFSSDELHIIQEWNNFIKGDFIILRHLKKYTIFLDEKEQKAYGVYRLYCPFEELVGLLPVMAHAVLLPFKGKIIFDGMLFRYNVTLSSGLRRNLNDTYQKAKFRYGIIESIPFSEKGEKSDEETLKFYLKSERNRDMYWEEIWDLIYGDPALEIVYHQEMGNVYARGLKKELRTIGVTKGWFAILEGVSIASGVTKDETERIVKSIVPKKKLKFVYYFQLT